MLAWIGSIETYCVHGAAHPVSRKARRLAIDLERIALAERTLEAKRARVMSRTPAESQGPERFVVGGSYARTTRGRRFGDGASQVLVAGEPGENFSSVVPAPGHDPATRLPEMYWKGGRVYWVGSERGYETLSEALSAFGLNEHASAGSMRRYPTLDERAALRGKRGGAA